jgi:hypothetical protein
MTDFGGIIAQGGRQPDLRCMVVIHASASHSAQAIECPACKHGASLPFLSIERAPVFCNVLHTSASVARDTSSSEIDLVICERCALIYNRKFNPSFVQYSAGYQNPLHVSEAFRGFAEELSAKLVKNHHLFGGTAIEIGCGDGFFLDRLVHAGMREGIGYDPTMRDRTTENDTRIKIVPELFSLDQTLSSVDAIICRHVFEHLPNPLEFLTKLRSNIGSQNTMMYFEVPDATRMLESISIWDVIFEHFTYWTAGALTTLFVRCGFKPLSVSSDFGKQFLMLEARPQLSHTSWPSPTEIRAIGKQCRHFAEASTKLVSHWKAVLCELRAQGRTAVVWGAGSKGITFASLVAEQEPLLAGIVDINAGKQGKYAPLTGIPILAPSHLNVLRPDVVILMNENYTREVTKLLNEVGLAANVKQVAQDLDLAA